MSGRNDRRRRPRRQPRSRAAAAACASACPSRIPWRHRRCPAKAFRWRSRVAMEAPRCVARRPSPPLAAAVAACSGRPVRRACLRRVERRHAARARSESLASMSSGRCRSFRRTPATRISRRSASMLYTSTSNGCGGAAERCLGDHAGSDRTRPSARGKRTAAARSAISHSRRAARFSWPSVPGTTSAGGYANAIVALDAKTLQPTDWFTSPRLRVRDDTGRRQSWRSRDRRRRDARRRIFLLDAAVARWRQSLDAALLVESLDGQLRARCPGHLRAACGHAVAARARPRGIVAFRIVDDGGKIAPPTRMDVTRSCRTHRADCRERRRLRGSERPAPGSSSAVCIRLAIGSRALEQRPDDDVVRAAGKSLGQQQPGARRHLRRHGLRLRVRARAAVAQSTSSQALKR